MKKIILLMILVSLFFSGCARIGEKEHHADTPAQKTGAGTDIASPDIGEAIGIVSEESVEEISVEVGENTEFAVPSGKGIMSVSIPEGALSDVSALNVSALAGSSEGYLSPGFLCEDKANPGEHLTLSAPAVISYWQQEPLPEDTYIVRYSDDFNKIYPMPCLRLETSDGLYGLMTQVDSFSAYGTYSFFPRKPEEEIDPKDIVLKESYIWRIEAESREVRINNIMQLESLDESYYLYADSKRTNEYWLNTYDVPRTYRGALHINQFIIAQEKAEFDGEELPIVILMNTADKNLVLTVIPKFKKGPLKSLPAKDGVSIVSLTEFEPPVFDGYIGWGTANLTVQDDAALGAAVVEGGGWEYWEVPITVRVKGFEAKVRFVDLFAGPVELNGKFIGIEKNAPAITPAQPADPSKTYAPGKPDNRPPQPENPLGDLEGVTQDGNKITQTLPGGGSVSIIYSTDGEDEDVKNAATIESFYKSWNGALNNIEYANNPENWED